MNKDIHSNEFDMISKEYIEKKTINCSAKIIVEESSASTNTELKQMAENGAEHGTVLIANEQSGGRGRLGRSFFSPQGTGLYMSLLLRPSNYPPEIVVKITTIAAVAVCEAIESVCTEEPLIKWINDIYMRGKKVCGILTEASFGKDGKSIEYAIVGVGINVYEPYEGFPKEIQNVAGSVFVKKNGDYKNMIASKFINRFYDMYGNLENIDYIEQYRKRCFVIGKRINVLTNNKDRSATALDIDDDCRLSVKYDDGTMDLLSSGEISIRVI